MRKDNALYEESRIVPETMKGQSLGLGELKTYQDPKKAPKKPGMIATVMKNVYTWTHS